MKQKESINTEVLVELVNKLADTAHEGCVNTFLKILFLFADEKRNRKRDKLFVLVQRFYKINSSREHL